MVCISGFAATVYASASPLFGDMAGTDLKVIAPAATEILGPDVHRLATLPTNAKSDRELLQVWLKSHADGSPHTVRVYRRVGERFIAVLAARSSDLRKATVEDV
jgi:hypothetical protein